VTPDSLSPFGTFTPPAGHLRLLRLAQHAPQNAFGKQVARIARGLYLWRAPLPADVSIGEMRLRCYLRDNTSERKFVFTPWRFDPIERAALASALRPDGVFVDVGANVGIYTLTAALRLGAAGRIVALEPFPAAYQRLLFNIASTRAGRDDWPRIDTLQVGAAARDEIRELRIDAGNLGGGSIAGTTRFARADSEAAVAIRCRPLVDILAELDVRRVDMLKIDIEGAEDIALVPFLADTTESLLPRRMIVENSEPLWKADLTGALAARGYRALMRTRLNTIWAR
jgi:FkbM family methyltransferase